MNVKVLSSMSQAEIVEFDRLMHNVYQANDEVQIAHEQMNFGHATQTQVDEMVQAETRALNGFNKFKQEMIEKHLVIKFYGFDDKDEIV